MKRGDIDWKGHLSSWLPVALWMAFIFFLSGQVGLASEEMRSSGFSWTLPLRPLAHFGLYAVLSLLVQRGLRGHRHTLALTLLICTVYAASDEFHQSFVPGRGAKVSDAGVDVAGAVGALALMVVAKRLVPHLVGGPVPEGNSKPPRR